MHPFSEAMLTWYTILIIMLPFLFGVGLGLYALLHPKPRESALIRLCQFNFAVQLLLLLLLLVGMELRAFRPLLHLSSLSQQLHAHGIDFSLQVDRFSLLYLFLASALMGLIGRFSFTYLHLDKGFFRFFVLLLLFSHGLNLIVVAGNLDMLFVGWELIGITSVLLIAFFQERKGPIKSALYVFLVYRIGDIALLAACIWMHQRYGSTQWSVLQKAGAGAAPILGLSFLLLLAAMIKASQFPFLHWLPRAMEGPTPSSGLFYGALSTHVGIFLLMRIHPFLTRTPGLLTALIAIGVITSLFGSIVGRIQPDAKNSLAYATIVQLGLMCVELGLGWLTLVQLHLLGHTMLRAYQYLKTPSLLHSYHEMSSLQGRHFSPTGVHWERLIPQRAQIWLYHLALERGFLWAATERFLLGPLMRLIGVLRKLDDAYLGRLLTSKRNKAESEATTPLLRTKPHITSSSKEVTR